MSVQVSITLFGQAPWGFRAAGGIEHKQPLVVSRISPGTIAFKAGVRVGDIIHAVNGAFTKGWTSIQFEAAIREKNSLHLVLLRRDSASRPMQANGNATSYNIRVPNHHTGQANQAVQAHTFNPGQPRTYSPQQHTEHAGQNISYNPNNVNNQQQQYVYSAPEPTSVQVGPNKKVDEIADNVRERAIRTGNVTLEGPVTNTKFSTSTYNTPMGLYSNDNMVNVLATQSQQAGFGMQVPYTAQASPNLKRSKVLKQLQNENVDNRKIIQTKSLQHLGN